nr:serine/arginine-rich splicing factor SR45-like [Taeniopygia guttata]
MGTVYSHASRGGKILRRKRYGTGQARPRLRAASPPARRAEQRRTPPQKPPGTPPPWKTPGTPPPRKTPAKTPPQKNPEKPPLPNPSRHRRRSEIRDQRRSRARGALGESRRERPESQGPRLGENPRPPGHAVALKMAPNAAEGGGTRAVPTRKLRHRAISEMRACGRKGRRARCKRESGLAPPFPDLATCRQPTDTRGGSPGSPSVGRVVAVAKTDAPPAQGGS